MTQSIHPTPVRSEADHHQIIQPAFTTGDLARGVAAKALNNYSLKAFGLACMALGIWLTPYAIAKNKPLVQFASGVGAIAMLQRASVAVTRATQKRGRHLVEQRASELIHSGHVARRVVASRQQSEMQTGIAQFRAAAQQAAMIATQAPAQYFDALPQMQMPELGEEDIARQIAINCMSRDNASSVAVCCPRRTGKTYLMKAVLGYANQASEGIGDFHIFAGKEEDPAKSPYCGLMANVERYLHTGDSANIPGMVLRLNGLVNGVLELNDPSPTMVINDEWNNSLVAADTYKSVIGKVPYQLGSRRSNIDPDKALKNLAKEIITKGPSRRFTTIITSHSPRVADMGINKAIQNNMGFAILGRGPFVTAIEETLIGGKDSPIQNRTEREPLKLQYDAWKASTTDAERDQIVICLTNVGGAWRLCTLPKYHEMSWINIGYQGISPEYQEPTPVVQPPAPHTPPSIPRVPVSLQTSVPQAVAPVIQQEPMVGREPAVFLQVNDDLELEDEPNSEPQILLSPNPQTTPNPQTPLIPAQGIVQETSLITEFGEFFTGIMNSPQRAASYLDDEGYLSVRQLYQNWASRRFEGISEFRQMLQAVGTVTDDGSRWKP